MKLRSVVAVIVAALLMSPAASHGQARSEALADGQITKIDVSAQKITIRHGPLKQFDMDEPMTMVFRAANPEMLKTVKAGDKVKFLPERINGQFTVTKIEKVK